jgi:hypothetical protein
MIAAGLLSLAVLRVCGQDQYFYRISSTQETRIVSFASDGTLAWSNLVSNAQFDVQRACQLTGCWSRTCPYTVINVLSNTTTVKLNLSPQPPAYPQVPGQLGVLFRTGVADSEKVALLTSYALSGIPSSEWWTVTVPVGEEGFWYSTLQTNSLVAAVAGVVYGDPQ